MIRRTAINGVGMMAFAMLFPNALSFSGWLPIVIGALVLALLDVSVKPVLHVLSFPITMMTLGFFWWLVNAIVLSLMMVLVPGVGTSSFAATMGLAVFLSLINMLLGPER